MSTSETAEPQTRADATPSEPSPAESPEARRARILAARARRKAAAPQEDPAVVAARTRRGVRKTMTIMLTAAAVMALLNADGLLSWAYDLEGSATSDTIVAIAEGWRDLLAPTGLNDLTEAVHEQVQEWRDVYW